jgi:hypothetical protein
MIFFIFLYVISRCQQIYWQVDDKFQTTDGLGTVTNRVQNMILQQ